MVPTLRFGPLVALFGALMVSPDAMLVRWLVEAGVNTWCLLFWKMVGCGVVAGGYAVIRGGGPRRVAVGLVAGGGYVASGMLLQSLVDVGFTVSLVTTSAAHTILLVDLNPLWAAVLGFFCLGEVVQLRTRLAVFAAFCAVVVIFLPELAPQVGGGRDNDVTLSGDVIAIATGVCLAAYLTLVRRASVAVPDADMTASAACGGLLAAVFAVCVAKGDIGPRSSGYDAHKPLWHFFAVSFADSICAAPPLSSSSSVRVVAPSLARSLVGFGIFFFLLRIIMRLQIGVGALFVSISIAPKYCSGPEIGLIMLLETILGPFWVWVVFGSTPGVFTLVGGLLLIATLALHELAATMNIGGSAAEAPSKEEPTASLRITGGGDNDGDLLPDVAAPASPPV